jgi:thioredoxin 1
MITGSNVTDATEGTFDETVLQSELPVLVDFWAEWCGPCHWLEPVLGQIAGELEGKLRIVKVDADANPALVRRYGTMSLPSLLLFRDGVERTRVIGAMPKRRLLAELTPFLEGAAAR